jgi:hypothetical protein
MLHADAIGDLARVDGEDQRKRGEERGEDADLEGSRRCEARERHQHLGSTHGDALQERTQDGDVDDQGFDVPWAGTRFLWLRSVY